MSVMDERGWAVARLMRSVVADKAFPLGNAMLAPAALLLFGALLVATVRDAVVVETFSKVVEAPRAVWFTLMYLVCVLLGPRSQAMISRDQRL